MALRIDHPHRRAPVGLGERARRDLDAGGADSRMRPVTVAPSRMASGGSEMPTLTWNVRVTASACGEISRTRPVAFTCGSLLRAISTSGSRGPD